MKNVKIVATRLSSKPKEISEPTTDKLYKYLDISHPTLNNIKIKKHNITFSVEKSWYEKSERQKKEQSF